MLLLRGEAKYSEWLTRMGKLMSKLCWMFLKKEGQVGLRLLIEIIYFPIKFNEQSEADLSLFL